MIDTTLRPVSAAETRPLRHRILRPHQRVEDVALPHDEDVDTLHLGAFVDGVMIGTATVHREALPGTTDPNAWRLRGMATEPDARRRGCGSKLVAGCVEHAKKHGGSRMWCTARETAKGFYDALGFATIGDPFDIPDVGPHYVMELTFS
jgi:ribosomal protein S18 acetylase RimI-like enzyme